MSNPLVTIVITAYNYAEYIKDAIESVLNQTHKNIEIIVIDDGSTDNTGEVLKEFENNSKVTIISRENKGIIYTRNQGVALSRGVYTMQLDADDTLEPTYIEECVFKAEREKLDIVYTQTRTFGRVEYISDYIDYDLEALKHYGYMHATSLVRKSKINKDPYDPYMDRLGNEDWDMFLDMCLDGAKAGLVNKPLLNYRKHVDRKSRADDFEGLYKETLVQHHIWSKQNEKHPDQFWYFSSLIDECLQIIKIVEAKLKLEEDNKALDHEVKRYRNRVFIFENSKLYILLRKVKQHFKTFTSRV